MGKLDSVYVHRYQGAASGKKRGKSGVSRQRNTSLLKKKGFLNKFSLAERSFRGKKLSFRGSFRSSKKKKIADVERSVSAPK